MIILDSITKSLELKLGGAITTNQLPVVVSYIDVTTTTYTPIESDTITTGTTAVTIAAAPAASTQRQIKYISVQNQDTVAATIILQYNDNATIRQIAKILLAVNDTFFYTDGEGYRVMDNNGCIKTVGTITGAALTKTDDTNVTLTLGGTPTLALLQATSLTLGWTGTLADGRIASAGNWNTAYTNRITSLTTTGSGAATLVSNVLNIPTPPSATFTSLTVTGNSGASTLSAGVLNVPTYSLSGLGGQPLATNLTSLSGLTYASLAFVKMSASGTFSLDTNTYITGNQTITLSGDVTGSGTTAITASISNTTVTGKLLTGYVSGAGVVASTDSILQAIQKLNGNIGALTTGVSSVNGGTGAVTVTVTGTANKIDVSGGTGLTPTITISATYVGQTSITTLGTVATGTLGTGAVIGGVTMTLGSDASYDMYYRNSSGVLTRLANGTTGQVLTATTSNAPSWAAAGGSGANTALSNLASVSINTSLLAQTGVDLGGTSNQFRNLYLFGAGTYGTTYLKLTGTPTSTRTQTFPDNTGTVANINIDNSWASSQTFRFGIATNINQQVSINTSAPNQTYKTTNGGSTVTPALFVGTNNMTSGVTGLAYDQTNQMSFMAGNASTVNITRAAIQTINLTNTAGSETGDLALYTKPSTGAIVQNMRISALGSVVLGNEVALATNANDGFLYIPTCAGTPSGTPTAYTGKVALIYDTTNNKMYVYNGGWKGGTTPGTWI